MIFRRKSSAHDNARDDNAIAMIGRLQVLISTSSELAIPGYLQDKSTSDIVMAISKCDDNLKRAKGIPKRAKAKPLTMYDAVNSKAREAFVQEVKRRGETHLLSK